MINYSTSYSPSASPDPARGAVPPPAYRPPAARRGKSPLKRGLVILLILAVLGAIGWKVMGDNHSATGKTSLASEVKAAVKISKPAPAPPPVTPPSFIAAVNALIAANPAITFSVSTINLTNGTQAHFGNTEAMQAASCAKMITATLFLHDVENGTASLNDQINGNTAQYELQRLINLSDNNAWAAFEIKLGWPALKAYATSIGVTGYNSSDNMTTDDLAVLLKKLYAGQLLNKAHTDMLLGYMQKTNYEQYIPPAIPATDTFYHKVGFLNDNVNDAAIITNGKQTFVLVIFTDGHGSQNWTGRAALMQQITKDALSAYFT